MAKGGAAMIEIICNGDDEAKEKNEKNEKIRQTEEQKKLSKLEMSVQNGKFK